MAIVRLDNSQGTSSDSNDGSDWTTNVMDTIGAAFTSAGPGGTVLMSENHDEDAAVIWTVDASGTVNSWNYLIVCQNGVDTPVTTYGATSNISTSTASDTIKLTGWCYVWGLNIEPYDGLWINEFAGRWIFENCLINDIASDSASQIQTTQDGTSLLLLDTDIKNGGLRASYGGTIEWRGGTYISSGIEDSFLVTPGYEGGRVVIDGVDLSAYAGATLIDTSFDNSDEACDLEIKNCKLKSGIAIHSGESTNYTNDGRVFIHSCGLDDETYQYYYKDYTGTIQDELTIVRTGGSTYDGTNEFSVKLTTNTKPQNYVTPIRFRLWAQPLDVTTATTITVHIAYDSASTLDNSQVSIEVKYPDATNYVLSKWASTKPTTGVTAGDRTSFTDVSGASPWEGISGWTNPNEETIEIDVTGGVGVVECWISLSEASTILYADCKPEAA